jgi:hypothetical protein
MLRTCQYLPWVPCCHILYTFRLSSNAILSTCIQDDIRRLEGRGARRIPRARGLFFCTAPLHLPWWPALSVTIPAVCNRILHRRHRRHRQHSSSRHYHNGAFLIIVTCASQILVASSIRWHTSGIFCLRFSLYVCNSPTARANNSPGPGV